MLKLNPANRRDDVEQQTGLQENRDFREEIRELESLISNLTLPEVSQEKKHGQKGKRHRSFGFKKLSLRRNKKKSAAANDEQTKEEFVERVKRLQGICKDLSQRLKEDEILNGTAASEEANTMMEENRDDDEIMMFRQRINDEEEKREEERNELMVAIAACEKILSKFAPESTVEVTENDEANNDEATEQDDEEAETLAEDDAETTDEIQFTESEAVEGSSSLMCCYDFKIIEMIENLLRYLTCEPSDEEEMKAIEAELNEEKTVKEEEGDRQEEVEGEEEPEATEKNEEEKVYGGCFCCASEMLTLGLDDEELQEDMGFQQTESEYTSAVTTTATECETTAEDEQTASPGEPVEDSKIEDSTAENADTSIPEEKSSTNEEPSEEDEVTSSPLSCGIFSALCLQRTNTGPEPAENTDSTDEKPQKEEQISTEISTPCECDPMDLCALESMDNSIKEDEKPDETALFDAASGSFDAENKTTPIEGNEQAEGGAATGQGCDLLDPIHCIVGVVAVGACMKAAGDEGRRAFGNDASLPDFSPSRSFELSTLAASTFGYNDDGTIDNGCFTSLDSLVGAKSVPEPVMSEEMFDTIEAEQEVKKKVANTVESMFDMQVCIVPSGAGDDQALKTVDTMDFIPRIEVVGMKKPEKQPSGFKKIFAKSSSHSREKSSSHSREKWSSHSRDVKKMEPSTPKKASTTRNASTPKRGNGKIQPIVTTHDVPKLNLKSPKKDTKKAKSPRQLKSPKKQKASKEMVTTTKTGEQGRKPTQREYRRIAAQKRRKERKSKRTPKQGRNSKKLGVITESPVKEKFDFEEKEMIRRRVNEMYRDTPESLSDKPGEELPPPIVADVLNFFSLSPPNSARQGRSRAYSAGDSDLIDSETTTSTLTDWTDGKCVKEIKVTRNDSDSEYEVNKKKKSWSLFNRKKQEDHAEIMECMSPVLSIPALSTIGTRYGNDDDADYVNRYYNFSEDERFNKGDNDYDYEGDVYDEGRDDDGFGKF